MHGPLVFPRQSKKAIIDLCVNIRPVSGVFVGGCYTEREIEKGH